MPLLVQRLSVLRLAEILAVVGAVAEADRHAPFYTRRSGSGCSCPRAWPNKPCRVNALRADRNSRHRARIDDGADLSLCAATDGISHHAAALTSGFSPPSKHVVAITIA